MIAIVKNSTGQAVFPDCLFVQNLVGKRIVIFDHAILVRIAVVPILAPGADFFPKGVIFAQKIAIVTVTFILARLPDRAALALIIVTA